MALSILAGAPPSKAADLVDGVACVVNDDVITLSEIYELGGEYIGQRCGVLTPGASSECISAAEAEIADTLILQSLVKQKLVEAGQDVGNTDLDRTIDQIMRENGIENREDFRAALESQGFTWEAYRVQLRDQIRMMKFREVFLRPLVRVTEDEIRDQYQRATRDLTSEPELTMSFLVFDLPPDASAAQILELKANLLETAVALRDGSATWDQAASRVGREPQRFSTTYTPSQLIAELKSMAEVQEGQVAGPFQVGNRWFLVRMDARKTGGAVPYEQVRDRLEAQIAEQRLEDQAEAWFQSARR
jgi:peptidyl-prolyl cis-trans isomerase SurA